MTQGKELAPCGVQLGPHGAADPKSHVLDRAGGLFVGRGSNLLYDTGGWGKDAKRNHWKNSSSRDYESKGGGCDLAEGEAGFGIQIQNRAT
jgi:hypothetical protein